MTGHMKIVVENDETSDITAFNIYYTVYFKTCFDSTSSS